MQWPMMIFKMLSLLPYQQFWISTPGFTPETPWSTEDTLPEKFQFLTVVTDNTPNHLSRMSPDFRPELRHIKSEQKSTIWMQLLSE